MTHREQFEAAAARLLAESGCTVRRWRTGNTGAAWTRDADWGIEVPEPRGPISFGTFAHEVGHQMLHRGNGSTARWLEEIEAWEYALAQFDRFELPGRERAQADAAKCLRYAASKAERRCGPATAQLILDRMPAWVWAGTEHDGRVSGRLVDRALEATATA